MEIAVVIMAAGQGTRMKSRLPKVLHPVLGKLMLWYPLEAAKQAAGTKPVAVVGYGAEQVEAAFGAEMVYVHQAQQLGTGHAVQQAAPVLKGKSELVLVVPGDMPLLSADTFSSLIHNQAEHAGPLTMLTAVTEQPRGFGRILRSPDGSVMAIVEEAQATPEQLSIRELNVGAYCFRADWLWDALDRIQLSPKGEYYLTDLVEIAVQSGQTVRAIQLANSAEGIGVNTRVHLAEATKWIQARVNQQVMLAGVTLVDPATTYIEPGVEIGPDTVIWPNTHLQGGTKIGRGCEIGPNCLIVDTQIGEDCQIQASVLESAVLENEVEIGPFAHLRKGAHLAQGVHMGNYGEVKNSYLGPGTKMGHFSYIGDATIGSEVNIGAGTITCNYDGEKKSPTQIGDGAFIGSDTMLVAPLEIGEGARTGAGAVVTKNVPERSLAVGVPARVIRKFNHSD